MFQCYLTCVRWLCTLPRIVAGTRGGGVMHAGLGSGRDRRSLAALVMAVPLLVAACGGGTASPAPATAPASSAAAPSAAPESAAPASPAAGETLELAYISFAVANSYD